jgi:hypothetical protein
LFFPLAAAGQIGLSPPATKGRCWPEATDGVKFDGLLGWRMIRKSGPRFFPKRSCTNNRLKTRLRFDLKQSRF